MQNEIQDGNLFAPASVGAADPSLFNTITLCSAGKEMLRISPEGFHVRGVKIEQDEGEARKVFEAFIEFLKGNTAYR